MEQAKQPTPEAIMQLGTGFWASKILLTAINFELFTLLAQHEKMSGKAIKTALQLKCTDRHLYDFLDVLNSFGFLKRTGLLDKAEYSNGTDTDVFLDKNKPSYIGGILEMMNNRLYGFWGNLDDALRTGEAQNEVKYGQKPVFEVLYENPALLKEFVNAMTGMQIGNFMTLAQQFDFSTYKTFTDIGGSAGVLAVMVAQHNANMTCTTLDLPPVEPIAQETIEQFQMTERVKAVSGDFFEIDFPKSDVIAMGNILHDWDEPTKVQLLQKAYDALPEGGAFIAIEAVIDNERQQNPFGLMMSLNMLIETAHGFDYTFDDFNKWAKQVGFKTTSSMTLTGPTSAVIAYK